LPKINKNNQIQILKNGYVQYPLFGRMYAGFLDRKHDMNDQSMNNKVYYCFWRHRYILTISQSMNDYINTFEDIDVS